MKNDLPISRRLFLAGSAALAGSQSVPVFASTNKKLQATVVTGRTFPSISPYIYGGFLEHIGNLINHSLWSEVLDDRKFYYGVLEKPDPKPDDPRAARGYLNKWTHIGPASAFTLNTVTPYTGKQSPQIMLDENTDRGITQAGLAVIGSKRYVGRLVLAADHRTKVNVTLVIGSKQSKAKTLTAKGKWRTYNFDVVAPEDSTEAQLVITAKGRGTLQIGAVSLMPADNLYGFRADTVQLMKEMDCKILRVPGGNFISAYDWKHTIGDPDKRPPILDPVWKAVQPNDVGVDELLKLCELIECEPYWAVSTGFSEPRSGAELVEYVNGAADTEWGAKRAANGRKEPYNVKYWGIGNEMYGHWQRGHMSRDHYVVKHNLFADAMRAVDPNIYIIAPGGFVDEMTTGQGIFVKGQPEVKVGSERDWAYGMFKDSWGKFDALGTHAYPPEGKRFNLKTGELFDVKMSLTEWARQPANRIRTMVDAWEDYKKLFPALNDGSVKVFFDEWAYHFKDDFKGTLAIALAFHEFFRHTDFIDMAGYTMATGWIDCNRTESVISARGRIFQLYNQHFGTIPVDIVGNSPQPKPQYPIGGDQPRINSGSDTYPLDVSAALTSDKKVLTLAVVNATESSQKLNLGIQGVKLGDSGRCWTFTAKDLDARNAVGHEPEVFAKESVFDTQAEMLELPPICVKLYHYPLV